MITTNKTPVAVVQELIALHTTRKEIAEKIKAKQVDALLPLVNTAAKQSDEFIAALMNELSAYGDGVSPMVERENEYHLIWKNSLGNFDTATPADTEELFSNLESSLQNYYAQELESQVGLPETLVELLNRQLEELKSQSK